MVDGRDWRNGDDGDGRRRLCLGVRREESWRVDVIEELGVDVVGRSVWSPSLFVGLVSYAQVSRRRERTLDGGE